MFIRSYLADITTTQTRTSRLSILYGSMVISYPIANFLSIYIYSYGGYLAIWGTSLGVGVVTLLYVLFVVQDSRGREQETNDDVPYAHFDVLDANDASSVRCDFCTVISNLWECFDVTFQPRNGYKRACLCILLASMCFFILQSKTTTNITKRFNKNDYFFTVPGSITYLYTKKLFDWDQPQYALFSTISSLTAVLGKK